MADSWDSTSGQLPSHILGLIQFFAFQPSPSHFSLLQYISFTFCSTTASLTSTLLCICTSVTPLSKSSAIRQIRDVLRDLHRTYSPTPHLPRIWSLPELLEILLSSVDGTFAAFIFSRLGHVMHLLDLQARGISQGYKIETASKKLLWVSLKKGARHYFYGGTVYFWPSGIP